LLIEGLNSHAELRSTELGEEGSENVNVLPAHSRSFLMLAAILREELMVHSSFSPTTGLMLDSGTSKASGTLFEDNSFPIVVTIVAFDWDKTIVWLPRVE
jgi:hypothetical protein